jgi:hypothetical protein
MYAARIETVATHPGEASRRVAASISDSELSDLVALAAGLPSGWCVIVDTVYGQLSVGPASGTHWRSTDFVVDPSGRSGFLALARLARAR